MSTKDVFDLGFGGLLTGFGGMAYESESEHKQRKVANTKTKFGVIDTAYAPDTGFYETGICDTRYREDGEWIIVDECKTRVQAERMHSKWVKILNAKVLPEEIEDVHTDEIYLYKYGKTK